MHNIFKYLDITGFHAIKKPQFLPQDDVMIICYLVTYWFKIDLDDFTANQKSYCLNARLLSDKRNHSYCPQENNCQYKAITSSGC